MESSVIQVQGIGLGCTDFQVIPIVSVLTCEIVSKTTVLRIVKLKCNGFLVV